MSEEVKKETTVKNLSSLSIGDTSKREEKSTTQEERPRRRRRRTPKKLNLKCPICESNENNISYKDVYLLKKFTSVRGKIISTEKSGVCSKHQRDLTSAIKRARYVSLLPFVAMD